MKRKLLHYIKSHTICVVTSFGLGEIVRNHQVGTQANEARHNLRATNSDQVPGHGGFHGRTDRDLAAPHHGSFKSIGGCILMALSPSMVLGGIVLISPEGDRLL
jgi:hypothetical protein